MAKWLLVAAFIAGCHCSAPVAQNAPAAEIQPRAGQAGHLPEGPSGFLGKCRITVLETHVWRDWMPIVENPGPDGGSPLRAKVKVLLDNSSGPATKISFQAAVIDAGKQSRAIAFKVLSGTPWDGGLKKGESRTVELSAGNGPYIPAGSSVRITMTWTGRDGDSFVLTTPESTIERTD